MSALVVDEHLKQVLIIVKPTHLLHTLDYLKYL